LHDSTIIRLLDGQLLWYPPGAGQAPKAVASEEDLAQLRAWSEQPRGSLCFAVPGTDVTLLRVDYSAAEKKHIDKALPFTLEDQLASDIDDLHFSTAPLGKTSLCAAVCAKDKMNHWQVQLADLPAPNQWIPEPQLLPWQPGEWVIVLEEHSAIVRTGNCEGFGIDRSLLSALLEASLEDAAEPPAVVIVYGQDQAADVLMLPEAVRDQVQWRLGDFGAALLLSQEGNVAVNLLQGDFAHRLPLQRWWRQWRAVAAVFVAAFALQLIADYASYFNLKQENLELRREIEGSYRKAFPKGALVDAEKQVKRQLDALRGTAQSSGFISLMNAAGEIVASKPGTRIASINYNDKGGEMRMNITASDFEAVEAIRTAMVQNGLTAVMESSNVQGELVRARLRVGGGP
jgi:general secretion pathway protein L